MSFSLSVMSFGLLSQRKAKALQAKSQNALSPSLHNRGKASVPRCEWVPRRGGARLLARKNWRAPPLVLQSSGVGPVVRSGRLLALSGGRVVARLTPCCARYRAAGRACFAAAVASASAALCRRRFWVQRRAVSVVLFRVGQAWAKRQPWRLPSTRLTGGQFGASTRASCPPNLI